jgi:Spy/CpxP family protein refolding chaperone
MKRTLIFTSLACAASLTLGTAAQAQTSTPTLSGTSAPACTPGAWKGHHGGPHKEGGVLEHLTAALSLSGSQQAQIAPILEAAKPQMKAIHEQAQAARKTLIDSTASQITPLLSPDQQTKFAELVQKFEAGPGPGGPRHLGHHHGPGAADQSSSGAAAAPGAHGDMLQHLTTELGLTSDQQTQIKPILDAAHTQVQAIRQDTTVPQDQKFAKIKETMEAAHSQINGILTPAQQQQLAAMRAQFHHGHGAPEAQPSATPSATP